MTDSDKLRHPIQGVKRSVICVKASSINTVKNKESLQVFCFANKLKQTNIVEMVSKIKSS